MGKKIDCRAVILAALKLGTGNMAELQARTKLGKTTIWRWVQDLHDPEHPEKTEIHVVKWEYPTGGGFPMATYAHGPGKDAECKIKAMSEAQKSRRHRKKAKKDGRWDLRQARVNAKYWADRALKHRDPMIEALFGPAPAVRRSSTMEAV